MAQFFNNSERVTYYTRVLVTETYDLDDAIFDRLEFFSNKKGSIKGNTKLVRFSDEKYVNLTNIFTHNYTAVPGRPLTLRDISLQVSNQIGDKVEIDCSCNSDFMIPAMDRVNASIHRPYYLIPPNE